MRTLYLDCGMGAAGDMLTAALSELLPDQDAFFEKMNALGIPGVHFEKEKTQKCGITGTHSKVTVNGEEEESLDVHHHDHDHHHDHEDHEHHHDHDHEDHEHHHDHEHDENCTCGCHDHEEHEHHHEHDENCTCGCHDHEHHHHHHADDVFTSWGKETPHKFERAKLEEVLKKFVDSDNILRSKGMVESTDGTWLYFDMVPGEYEIREGEPDYTGRIVVIGTEIHEDELLKTFGL